MNTDNKNMLLAIVLSAIVLIGWQYFFAAPQMQKQKQIEQQQQAEQAPRPAPGVPGQGVPPQPADPAAATGGRPRPTAFRGSRLRWWPQWGRPVPWRPARWFPAPPLSSS